MVSSSRGPARCYGYRYLPKQYGCPPQVEIAPTEAAVVRQIYRYLVEDRMSCRQITKRLNESQTPTPTGQNSVWHAATVRTILTNRAYAGKARYNWRQGVIPRYRKTDEAHVRQLKTGRSYRPETEWVISAAPAIISEELFEKAQLQLQRNAELARKMYQPTSRRYLLRRLVQCGECGLATVCIRQASKGQKREYLYYECKGHAPLSVGRAQKCLSRRVRADRLDEVVWQSLDQLLSEPAVIQQLHAEWAWTKQQDLTQLAEREAQLHSRRQRLEKQEQKLLDAYEEDVITLSELKSRRQKLQAERHRLDQESQELRRDQQQVVHWQEVVAHVETFRQLLGDHLDQLTFEERQAVVQCLISKVVVTGEAVDIYYVLPFESAPWAYDNGGEMEEGATGQFYRLRLADRNTLRLLEDERLLFGRNTCYST